MGLELADRERVANRKLIEQYEQQVKDLREKLDNLEDMLKKKDDGLNRVLDGERSRAATADLEKK
ncbi:uncharacterized protein B0T15DRAFT_488481 [Chaetomium strumarium]|uniref:Uncharacterized protein n=1 Tax=Chaetomium strumarium TaxID=1170767 RepID=A0AAJ0H0W8_9PEZI|nr:hypothetical protein B0T15DRAFT_488481 [Chaetomium strumarium]